MPIGQQIVASLNYHLIFSTKNRIAIVDNDLLTKLRLLFKKTEEELNIIIHIMNGYQDHIHLLLSVPPKLSLSDTIRRLKGGSSHGISSLYWQDGYAIFTVSPSSFNSVFNYIKNQKKHHKKMDSIC